MNLSDHDLLQLTEKELEELPEAVVRKLSVKLLFDLKEARERLRQTSKTSSRPPSSDLPWDRNDAEDQSKNDVLVEHEPLNEKRDDDSYPEAKAEEDVTQSPSTRKRGQAGEDNPASPTGRKPGKQPGAPGFGRQQSIKITAEQCHYPERCTVCDADLATQLGKAYTAFETLDLIWGQAEQPGIQLTNTQHRYFEKCCERCGHVTQEGPHRQSSHPLTPTIECCEWRLIGPNLAALIVCLAYRMRLSRVRIQEFLHDWLALELSIGLIHATLQESGAAALPIEEALVEALQESPLVYVDETSWPEATQLLWLWVFCSDTVVAYWIASRGAELIDNVLGHEYAGLLMSDGWHVYRAFLNRLRCWAHLTRKAKGLDVSLDATARQFGQQTLQLFGRLMEAVYQARKHPPDQPLPQVFERELQAYRALCQSMTDAKHEKTRQLAREMLNDWEAIFHVLTQPDWPLTNNEAERMLRHWVILRRISHGTRTENGTRLFAILISVIETCRLRQQSPWIYLAEVIRLRRSGLPVPRLPLAKGG